MLDLVIRGGRVVTPHGVGEWDVAVAGETIAAIGTPGAFAGNATREIDAQGRIVVPGGIDPHVHCLWPLPNPDGGAPLMGASPEVVSRAALYGGTTTIIDFANWARGGTVRDSIAKRDEEWAGKCCCDYAYHIMLNGELPPEIVGELPGLIADGYPTVKIFTTDITPSRRGRKVDFGDLWEVMKVLAAHGGLGVIHAEDNDIVMHMYDKLIAEGRVGFENMAEVHNTLSEDLSFRRVIRLAEHVGCAIYMMHVSAGTGVAAIAESRARDYPIYGETLHQYMLFTAEDYKRPNGQIYHTYPSLKYRADQDALWQGTLDGTINCVATDEICCSLAVKVLGKRIDDTTGGNAGVEPRLGVMYAEMVEKRGYSLERYVDLVSTNAAKIMGLYPRKGTIAVGSDADIALLTPGEKRRVRKEDLHETDYSPWEGHEITAWPTTTILRGKVVVEDGRFAGGQADGKYLKRAVADDIRARRAL